MIGKTIKNRYRILKRIGSGGMAEVFKAIDTVLDREVAVKILLQQYIHDNDFINRFRREAQSAASLSHKNVVSILDVGEEEDIYFIVMEYVEGSTLKELIQKKGSLPVKEALDITKKIASALEHAHNNNIVHRDIKPHNILIGKYGEVKVTDFGIARAASQATITHTGSVLGSVHYLSPEQAKGGHTDEKSDIYSLGIVLYEMVTGKLPFSGDSPISVALKHLQENFTYPRDINPDIPQSVENIILRALVKDPNRRYQSAEEMLGDLETALDPSRINEPQIVIDTEELVNDDKTLIMPAFINKTSYITQSRKTKKNKLRGKFAVILAFIAFIIVSFYGVQYVKGILIVPTVEMPLLEGKHEDEAIQELTKLNLEYKIEERYDPVVKDEYVIKQEPYQGSKIKVTQEVTIYVSMGKKQVEMPNVINYQQGQATFLLEKQGFTNFEFIQSYDENTASGSIFRQEPSPDSLVIPDETKVILFVSKGKENFEMPNLIGKNQAETEAILTANGLTLGKVNYGYSYEQPAGKVYKQFPYEPGMQVTMGDQIDIYISKGYPENAKTINSEIFVLYSENKEAKIKIVINDAREKDIVWREETIDGPKLYSNIEMILTPETEGTIRVYIDGKLYQTETVGYY